MTGLDSWLKQATWQLSKGSAAQVRTEIQEHYESAWAAAMGSGTTAGKADQIALFALGDAKAANRQYREALLTTAEASVLRQSNWEARIFCSRRWLKRVLLAIPVALLLAATVLFLRGATDLAQVMLGGGIALGAVLVAPFLPVFTPARARVFRYVKYAAFIGGLAFAFGPDMLKSYWLLAACLWPMFWIEGIRFSIRRKTPVSKWPKQLYL